MIGGRLLRIGAAVAGLLALAAVERLRGTPAEASRLPLRLRLALERLGPTFVKLGQTVSLRTDLLSGAWLAELRRLQDRVAPFPGTEARQAVEAAFGRPVEQVFAAFETEPMATASIAQMHRARLKDGRAVIVKVRRPGVREQIDRDMRALLGVARLAVAVAPRLRRVQPLRILDEIWANIRKEADFHQEARNIRSFREAFRRWPTLYSPDAVEDLCA